MQDEMRAFVLEGPADAVKGSLQRIPTSQLPEGELTVRVHYSGINFKDALVSAGVRRMVRTFPHVPGIDLAGEVVEDTSGRFSPGQQVLVTGYHLGVGHWGGYAEYARMPSAWAHALPQGLSALEAMTLGTAGFTAMLCVLALERNGLKPGNGPVLVTGATGGVGSVAIELLAAAGHEVTASSGKPDMADYLRGLGATDIISREAVLDDSGKPLLAETWAGAVENAGGATLESILRSTKSGGSVALCGLVADHAFTGTVFPFILRGVNLLGIDSVTIGREPRDEAWTALGGARKPKHLAEIGHVITPEELPAKLAEIGDGQARGRYVVDFQ